MTAADERLANPVRDVTWQQTVGLAYERRARQLWEYGRRLGLDPGSAEEAMQEVFARILHLPRVRRPDNLDAWLFRSLHNQSMDRHRRARHVQVVDISLDIVESGGSVVAHTCSWSSRTTTRWPQRSPPRLAFSAR